MDDQSAFEFEIVNGDDEDHTLNNTTDSCEFVDASCEFVDASIEDIRNNKKEAVMTDKMVNPEDDSTLNNTITSSCELVDVTIEDVRNNKKTLASTMDLVISLMREVECKEKAVEQTKAKAVTSGLAILAKVEELKQAQQHAKETNDTHAKEVNAQKVVLAAEMKELQFRVSGLLNEGGTSVGVLDEMRKALEKRLTSALREKELADKEKLKKELSAQKALAYEESQMKKLVEKSERLKLEATKNSKLQEFLTDRGRVVDMLDGDMSKKCQDVNLLKESLDQEVSLSEVLLSSQTPSIIASLTSFLTNEIPNEGNQPDDSHVILEKSFSFGIDASFDDHVQSATEKQIKTPYIIASSSSSSTNEIPKGRNETADSSVVLEKSCGFGLDASADQVQRATQKQIKTPPVIVSSSSSLTNEIPDKINEPADSHVVLKKSFVFGLDASTDDHVQSTTQKQIKSRNSATLVVSSENELFSKISTLHLEKQEGNKNVAFEAGVKNAGYSKVGHAMSTESWAASAPNFSEGIRFLSTITSSTFKEGLRGTRKKRHFKKTDYRG